MSKALYFLGPIFLGVFLAWYIQPNHPVPHKFKDGSVGVKYTIKVWSTKTQLDVQMEIPPGWTIVQAGQHDKLLVVPVGNVPNLVLIDRMEPNKVYYVDLYYQGKGDLNFSYTTKVPN